MPSTSGVWSGRVTRMAGALLAVALAAACGGGSSSPAKSSTTPTAATTTSPPPPTTTPTTTPTPTSSGPAATGSAPADPAAASAQVKKNWQAFFDPATPVTGKIALVENGDQLQPLLQGFAADPRIGQVNATVSNVAFTSPTSATVTYSISLQGTVVEPNATGKAVLQNGTWKVSLVTLCGLVALTGNVSLPGCG